MDNMRAQKIVNLLSAILVLSAGFYVIIFLPLHISGTARALIGVLLVVYFLFRLRYYTKRYGSDSEKIDQVGRDEKNKIT